MEQHVELIKKYRVELDKYFSIMGKMERSREISLAITTAQSAKMWLGKTLEALDQPNPYPDSKNAANTKIAPTADVFSGDIEKELEGVAHIQKVKTLRARLTDLYNNISEKYLQNVDVNIFPTALGTINKAWEYVVESNMWLGMELGRINNESNK